MPIHPSSAADVARLVAELASPDLLRRETAVARLALIGPRAVTPLLALASDGGASSEARVAALGALESINDSRTSTICTEIATGGNDVLATAAIGVLAAIAHGTGAHALAVFDQLATLALDRDASVERRLAAVAALEGFPERVVRPLYAALAKDPASRLVARVTRRQSGVMMPLEDLAAGALPDDAALVGAIVHEDAGDTRVSVLRTLVDAVRSRERRASGADAPLWLAVRGQLHQELAARGSRIAIYDLKETLAAMKAPLPVGFLAAAAAIGDAACLEPIADAWTRSDGDDRWWRAHLAEAFQAIVRRDGIKRRHPAIARILKRWPQAGTLVAAAKK